MSTPKRRKATKPPKRAKPTPKPQPREATPEEIHAEIAELTRLRPLIPPHTLFGDDNLAYIDAEIRALKEEMNESDVMDAFYPLDGSSFPDSEDPETQAAYVNADKGRSCDVESAARSAIEWRDGHSADKPSDGWRPLARKP